MNGNIINEKVFRVISQVMNIPLEQVNEHSSPENIEQWDSFQQMNLMLALEEDLKIKFTDEEISGMTDAKHILKTLRQKQNINE